MRVFPYLLDYTQDTTHLGATAPDTPLTVPGTAVAVERRHPDQCSDLLAVKGIAASQAGQRGNEESAVAGNVSPLRPQPAEISLRADGQLVRGQGQLRVDACRG